MWLLNIGLSHLEERGERYAHVEEIGDWTADDNDVDRWRYGFSSTGTGKRGRSIPEPRSFDRSTEQA
ncbi:protein of unknown function [Candidatus Methylomirabilis oxygeniifera]|uniref:Uncharacterized protein n=1 Tax=Methylomirabilis oxygeniifera TaxID=671143 RepID=D5MJP4_METO1|nr:protein of unknown function [Candidatus Methylomirabilis oxyfera]